jgi:prepilin-type N-terminal cleavage/methylation domain-containing protein
MSNDIRKLRPQESKAFTIMEIMLVVVILGVLASLALTRYTDTVERQRCGKARTNVSSILYGAKLYYDRAGYHAPSNANNTATINNAFGLDISDIYFNYSYTQASNILNVSATRTGGSYSLSGQWNLPAGTPPTITCGGGTCPPCD